MRCIPVILLTTLTVVGLSQMVFSQQPMSKAWLRQAEEACDKIEDGDAANLAFARLQAVYIQWGEIEQAEKITQRIKNREGQVKAHIAIAKHYAEAGNVERCKMELKLAKPLAVKSRLTGDELVEAYLQLAKSPPLAISFMSDDPDDAWARKKLCQALARHGYLDEALKIADSEVDVDKQNELKLTAALAAAKAGRIADTEKATQNLAVSYLAQQRIWGELAAALYKKKDLESARLYASRVNSSYIKRTNGYLRRIADNVPPNTPNIRTYAYPPTETKLPVIVPLPSEDPNAANRILEEVIAEAERNPVESTQGQFGPWNQKGHLARIRVQHALVAALYRKAGNQDQATRHMKLAEEALQTVTAENAWAAQQAFLELQHTLVSLEDIEGLKRLAVVADQPLFSWATDAIVAEILSSGDIERAKNLAKTALSGQAANGNRRNGRSEIVSCFINAGKVEAAHEIVKTSKPGNFTAAACENAGRVMIEMDGGQLLRTSKWRKDIGGFQRAHLCIGAALMAKEKSKAN